MLDNLSDEQKSVMLAKAMGWEIVGDGYDLENAPTEPYMLVDVNYTGEVSPNLYSPANMALAWRVLNWAIELDDSVSFRTWWGETKRESFGVVLNIYLGHMVLGALPPADAQRLWLNKILSLAIEAGLVEVDDVA